MAAKFWRGHREVVIIAKNDVEFLTAIASLPDGKIIFDLVGAVDDRQRVAGFYEGSVNLSRQQAGAQEPAAKT